MSAFDYDTIIRYVGDEMQVDERREFEQVLQADEGLKKEVELCRETLDSLRSNFYPDESEQALRTTLAQIQPAYFKPPTKIISLPTKRMRWRYISAAAAVILALFIWQPWKEDLYRQFASTKMVSVAERGTTADSLLTQATQKFNSGNFAAALPDFENILRREPSNAYTQFYFAVAMLEANQTTKAQDLLLNLYNSNSSFRYDAAFYLALSYLKENYRAKSIQWLQKISPEASVYPKAKTLLDKLR
jgi:tetratricopeptide (TPR) repeat protein